jgi:pyruvate formate lyase activating enzyme
MTGCIFDIKRFAIHDGPGIRTTVFLKGCRMDCLWCQNPEGLPFGRGLWVKREKCIGCGTCAAVCPEKALTLANDTVRINTDACRFCTICVERCPAKAIQRIDQGWDLDALIQELLLDKLFFDVSGGGITLSGGEPLAQPDFALAVLGRLKELGVHTCIETSLFVPPEVIRRLPDVLDYLICDIKILDEKNHQKYTGNSNALILENFRFLARTMPNMLVRAPLIPGITATEENLKAIGHFVRSCNPDIKIELLNYNWFSGSKYVLLDKPHFNTGARAFPEEDLARFNSWVSGTP